MNNWRIGHNRWQISDTDAKKRETSDGTSRIAAPKTAPKLVVVRPHPISSMYIQVMKTGVRITIHMFSFLHVAKCKTACRRKAFEY